MASSSKMSDGEFKGRMLERTESILKEIEEMKETSSRRMDHMEKKIDTNTQSIAANAKCIEGISTKVSFFGSLWGLIAGGAVGLLFRFFK